MSRRPSQTDVYPQILTLESGPQSASDAAVYATIPLPIPRFGGSTARPFVFELLRIQWGFQYPTAEGLNSVLDVQLSTVELDYDEGNPRTFFWDHLRVETSDAANAILNECHAVKELDYTDGNGHGILIATDNIYFYFDTAATSASTSQVFVRLLYRLIKVSAAEFIGIVQSQS